MSYIKTTSVLSLLFKLASRVSEKSPETSVCLETVKLEALEVIRKSQIWLVISNCRVKVCIPNISRVFDWVFWAIKSSCWPDTMMSSQTPVTFPEWGASIFTRIVLSWTHMGPTNTPRPFSFSFFALLDASYHFNGCCLISGQPCHVTGNSSFLRFNSPPPLYNSRTKCCWPWTPPTHSDRQSLVLEKGINESFHSIILVSSHRKWFRDSELSPTFAAGILQLLSILVLILVTGRFLYECLLKSYLLRSVRVMSVEYESHRECLSSGSDWITISSHIWAFVSPPFFWQQQKWLHLHWNPPSFSQQDKWEVKKASFC